MLWSLEKSCFHKCFLKYWQIPFSTIAAWEYINYTTKFNYWPYRVKKLSLSLPRIPYLSYVKTREIPKLIWALVSRITVIWSKGNKFSRTSWSDLYLEWGQPPYVQNVHHFLRISYVFDITILIDLPFGLYYGCRCAKGFDVDKLDNPVWSKVSHQVRTELCTYGGNKDFQTTLDVAAHIEL